MAGKRFRPVAAVFASGYVVLHSLVDGDASISVRTHYPCSKGVLLGGDAARAMIERRKALNSHRCVGLDDLGALHDRRPELAVGHVDAAGRQDRRRHATRFGLQLFGCWERSHPLVWVYCPEAAGTAAHSHPRAQ